MVDPCVFNYRYDPSQRIRSTNDYMTIFFYTDSLTIKNCILTSAKNILNS